MFLRTSNRLLPSMLIIVLHWALLCAIDLLAADPTSVGPSPGVETASVGCNQVLSPLASGSATGAEREAAIAGNLTASNFRGLRAIRNAYRLWTGRATRDISRESYQIFNKARQYPDQSHTEAELAQLREDGGEPLVQLFRQYAHQAKWVKALNHVWRKWGSPKLRPPGAVTFKKIGSLPFRERHWFSLGHLGYNVLATPLRLGQSVLGIPSWSTELSIWNLQRKIMKDPSYAPTTSEIPILKHLSFFSEPKLIKKWMLDKGIENLKDELGSEDAGWTGRIFALRSALMFLRMGVAGLGGLWLAAINTTSDVDITTEESFDPDHPDGMKEEDPVEIIVNLGPSDLYVPQIAIRIGSTIYLYGEMGSEILSIEQYQELEKEFGGESLGHVRFQLRPTPNEQLDLESRLLMVRAGQKHWFFPPYDTALGESNQDLSKTIGFGVPPILNRSQVGIRAKAILERWQEEGGVSKIIVATKDGKTFKGKSIDFGVNLLEAIFYLENAHKLWIIHPLVDWTESLNE